VPLYCGDHAIGLTGVYAVVNAMKLIMAETTPLQPSEERFLLELGWRFLGDRMAIMPCKGLRVSLIMRLTEAMLFAFGRRRQMSVQCNPIDRAALSAGATQVFLERCVVANRVVLILLGGAHYTVLKGYMSDSWLVFDALGRRWLSRSSVRLNRPFIPILSMYRPD